jgi:hypothetical protein
MTSLTAELLFGYAPNDHYGASSYGCRPGVSEHITSLIENPRVALRLGS